MTWFISIALTSGLVIWVFMNQRMFGKHPKSDRLERIRKSPNYKNGSFQNLNHTPTFTNGATYYSVMKEFFFGDKRRNKPVDLIPSIKTNLQALSPSADVLTWFGHSSYFMQLDGKKILVDPVLSGTASPIEFTTRAFKGTDIYKPHDIPEIDFLFISHDHWDHLDYKTLTQLRPKIKRVICALGVGEHLEHWGYGKSLIVEMDWREEKVIEKSFTVHTTPARHFSGRGFVRNQTLWTSFVLQTPSWKIFIGGDSGYDTHFLEVGNKFGPFDLVILENGQYDKNWQHIHGLPNETLQAAQDLKAKRLLPIHSSKFALANHDWDDPWRKITEFNKSINIPLVTPMIGEVVDLKNASQPFSEWWTNVR